MSLRLSLRSITLKLCTVHTYIYMYIYVNCLVTLQHTEIRPLTKAVNSCRNTEPPCIYLIYCTRPQVLFKLQWQTGSTSSICAASALQFSIYTQKANKQCHFILIPSAAKNVVLLHIVHCCDDCTEPQMIILLDKTFRDVHVNLSIRTAPIKICRIVLCSKKRELQ